jgi:integrase
VSINDVARRYAVASKAANTRRAYAAQIRQWLAYCESRGVAAFPPDPSMVANWLAGRAQAGQAISTIRSALAAVASGAQAAGTHLDTKVPVIATVLAGIARVEARGQRQAKPLRISDVVAILGSLGPHMMDVRDGALIAMGFIFAARRSEIVGLDWDRLRFGDGYVTVTAPTVEMHLVRSKTASATGEPETVIIPRCEVAAAVAALERWIDVANIRPGDPIFHRLSRSGRPLGRLHPQSVSGIIKRRVAAYYMMQGAPAIKATEEGDRYSGHSMRVGFATSAAEAGADPLAIASVTRHRSLAMVQRYARRANALRQSPFRKDGMGIK